MKEPPKKPSNSLEQPKKRRTRPSLDSDPLKVGGDEHTIALRDIERRDVAQDVDLRGWLNKLFLPYFVILLVIWPIVLIGTFVAWISGHITMQWTGAVSVVGGSGGIGLPAVIFRERLKHLAHHEYKSR
jgi:hypothetical protein